MTFGRRLYHFVSLLSIFFLFSLLSMFGFGWYFGIKQLIRASIIARIESQWVLQTGSIDQRINHSNVERKAPDITKKKKINRKTKYISMFETHKKLLNIQEKNNQPFTLNGITITEIMTNGIGFVKSTPRMWCTIVCWGKWLYFRR